MSNQYSQKRTQPAGEFPQPTSPWESRGLLYAEVVGVAVFLAAMLLSTSDIDTLLSEAPKAASQSVTATVAAAEVSDTALSLTDAQEPVAFPARN